MGHPAGGSRAMHSARSTRFAGFQPLESERESGQALGITIFCHVRGYVLFRCPCWVLSLMELPVCIGVIADLPTDMILFYCTFVSLKARSPEVLQVRQEEYRIKKEKLLFKA